MKIIDTHQHLWDPSLFTYSWIANIPPLDRRFTMGDYLAAAGDLEIVRTVHLEADVDEPFMRAETDHLLDLAGREGNPLAGVVAPVRLENKDFPDYLEHLVGNPFLKGVRRVLHTQPDELLENPTLRENVASLADYDLSFDLCVRASQLPPARKLIEACPRVTFILDHCGNPPLTNADALDAWRRDVAEIARFPQVVCKISGLVTNADHARWTPEDLRPAIEHVIERFGWDRVMFGSDWPVCTLAASLRDWYAALAFLTAGAGEIERRKLFHDNAVVIYRLESEG